MMRFHITPPSAADLNEIEEYIAQDNPDVAKRVIQEIRAAMRRLAEYPQLGHPRDDVDDPRYRFWPVYSYLIVYAFETDPLQIIRVIHGSRDVPAVLGR